MDPYTPQYLFETLSTILRDVKLSEIAVSPYILPDDTEDNNTTSSSSATNTASTSKATSRSGRKFSIRPFTLIEGDKLVIPQKPLYAIFGYCAKALSQFPRNALSPFHTQSKQNSIQRDQIGTPIPERIVQIDNITKCMIMQNPEHTRALNLRKKLILHYITESRNDVEQSSTDDVQAELESTKLILGIAANAKMGALWHHRKWLYALKYSISAEPQHYGTVVPPEPVLSTRQGGTLLRIDPIPLLWTDLQTELDLINTCAERYPRNYQAWAYRYWLVRGQSLHASQVGEDANVKDRSNRRFILVQEYEAMESHLSTHIGDHTAAVHLLNLLTLALGTDSGVEGTLADRVYKFAMDIVKRYPYKETPWLLLRGVLDILQNAKVQNAPESLGIDATLLKDALSLAENIREAKACTREVGDTGEGSRVEDWEMQQDRASVKFSTRTLFYLCCRYGMEGHPSLGSKKAREVLAEFG